MMIKTNELRLGNLVEFHDEGIIFEVTEVSETGIGVKNDDDDTWIDIDRFSGIPISPEWLKKFGFEETCRSDFRRKFDHPIYSEIGFDFNPEKPVGYFRYYDLNISALFVHQLQNLVFALTGEELELREK